METHWKFIKCWSGAGIGLGKHRDCDAIVIDEGFELHQRDYRVVPVADELANSTADFWEISLLNYI
ncbi:hypothetical protein [Collimonas sp.]|uniref:hypothetical protein n=1 Tax=Collimonas sp. TaxID=1963772 RepID=UPI002BA418B5|nr:hypothetical protein [Collimonas sp.]HWW08179.1 hypothetical protein [Collimonas sp.]